VCTHPNGAFYTDIRVGGTHLTLLMFDTVKQAARAYDAAAWRLGCPR
jgi:hypothetical protein